MALTNKTAADRAQRALEAQGLSRSIDDIENDIPIALEAISREVIGTTFQEALQTTLSLTLSSADSDGLQTASIGATVFEESIVVCNDVRMTAIGRFEYKPTIGHLFRLLSTSVVPCFTVIGQTLTARRPSAALPQTASALKVKAVLVLTAIASLPVSMESMFINKLIQMGGGNAMPVEAAAGQ